MKSAVAPVAGVAEQGAPAGAGPLIEDSPRTSRFWMGAYYHEQLNRAYRSIIPPGFRVLELGCAEGDLLASLKPSVGVGVEKNAALVAKARQNHKELTFIAGDVADLSLREK